MKFHHRPKRNTPSVIIVSLIDVLMVVLIFLLVTTTFKEFQASINLSIPEAAHSQTNNSPTTPLIITITKSDPHLHLDNKPISITTLETIFKQRFAANPRLILSIRADNDAPFGQIVKVRDAAHSTGITSIEAYVKPLKP